MLDAIALRDLRSTVAAAAPRDEVGRELLSKLREALTTRVNKLRSGWEEEITKALDEDRVVQALRISARPPEPTTRFPAALVERLVAAASAGMSSTVPKDRWLALLEAASNSPVRRSIRPEGLPADADGAVRQAATEAAGRIPALAKLLGLAMPPPPRPMAQRPLPPRPPRTARAVTSSTAADAAVAATPAPTVEEATGEVADAVPVIASPPATPPAAVQSESVQPEAVPPEAVASAAGDSAPAQSADFPEDSVAPDEPSSESASRGPEEPGASAPDVDEAEHQPSDMEPAGDADAASAPDPEQIGQGTAEADDVENAERPPDEGDAPASDLVEPLDNAVSIEPVAEPLAQAEEP
jgi:hypothetical protein